MKKVARENPLIPHARMRSLYRVLVETRALSERGPKPGGVPRGLEACWAATALDLREGDVTSDSGMPALPGYLRAVAARTGAGAPSITSVQTYLSAEKKPFAGSGAERLLCAAGAAMALKAAGGGAVSLAYARAGELNVKDWKRVLRVAAAEELPLVIVVVGGDGIASAGPAVPIIPVDAADAVALYRVAQESLLRARAGGGVAVIECVETGLDPVEVLGRQLEAKGIATGTWLAEADRRIRALLEGEADALHWTNGLAGAN